MSYLWSAGPAKHYGDDIKAKGPVFYIMSGEKIPCGPELFGSLGMCDGGFGRAKGLIGFGPDLDKDYGAIGVNHNEVDFAGFAGEVGGEPSKAFTF